VKIYPISGFNFYEERSKIYQLYAEYTGGNFNDLTYKVSYQIAEKGKTHFAVKQNQLYMLKLVGTEREWQLPYYLNNKENVIDLSFGDRLLEKEKKSVSKNKAIISLFWEKNGGILGIGWSNWNGIGGLEGNSNWSCRTKPMVR